MGYLEEEQACGFYSEGGVWGTAEEWRTVASTRRGQREGDQRGRGGAGGLDQGGGHGRIPDVL